MVLLLLAISCFAAVYLGQNLKLKLLVERIFLVSKRFFGIPTFFNYSIADGIYNLLFPDKTALQQVKTTTNDFLLFLILDRNSGNSSYFFVDTGLQLP
tara:strand:+ start:341 stop:634 length:294 start_codon:yes stop_codon:yes gene_type:complete